MKVELQPTPLATLNEHEVDADLVELFATLNLVTRVFNSPLYPAVNAYRDALWPLVQARGLDYAAKEAEVRAAMLAYLTP